MSSTYNLYGYYDSIETFNEEVEDTNIYSLLKRGDIIDLNPKGERENDIDNVFIWDGEEAIMMDYSIEMTGNIPYRFKINDTEFSPVWWKGVITEWNAVWLDEDIRKRAAKALERTDKRELFTVGTKFCVVESHPDNLEALSEEELQQGILNHNCPVFLDKEVGNGKRTNPYIFYIKEEYVEDDSDSEEEY
jgi:hypothetical protein